VARDSSSNSTANWNHWSVVVICRPRLTATVHGFRSTFSTWANENGIARPDVIEAAFAHREEDAVRRAYNRSCLVLLPDWHKAPQPSAHTRACRDVRARRRADSESPDARAS
jgi:integrase